MFEFWHFIHFQMVEIQLITFYCILKFHVILTNNRYCSILICLDRFWSRYCCSRSKLYRIAMIPTCKWKITKWNSKITKQYVNLNILNIVKRRQKSNKHFTVCVWMWVVCSIFFCSSWPLQSSGMSKTISKQTFPLGICLILDFVFELKCRAICTYAWSIPHCIRSIFRL